MMTGVGMILGTAAYMAPEQAKGRPADKRSDVWAFGCVLYEMLTGRRAFEGEDLSDTLANVLKSEPDWSALPADVPAARPDVDQRCLAKDRSDGWPIFRRAVRDDERRDRCRRPTARQVPARRRHLSVGGASRCRLLAAIVVGGAAVGAAVWLAMRPSAPRVTRFALSPTGAAALAVDQCQSRPRDHAGRHAHRLQRDRNQRHAALRARAGSARADAAHGLGAPRAPFSSPDGQWIGFVDIVPPSDSRKSPSPAEPTLPLCRLDGQSRGATWGDDGSIIFATSAPSTGLQRVSSAGGEPTVLTTPNRERGRRRSPLAAVLARQPGRAVYDHRDDGRASTPRRWRSSTCEPARRRCWCGAAARRSIVPSGHLVYAAAGTLRAVAFDLDAWRRSARRFRCCRRS